MNNVLKIKPFAFAIRIVRLFQFLQLEKKEYVLSKQVLRSGTSVGSMIREAEHAESKVDFVHKMSVLMLKMTLTGASPMKHRFKPAVLAAGIIFIAAFLELVRSYSHFLPAAP